MLEQFGDLLICSTLGQGMGLKIQDFAIKNHSLTLVLYVATKIQARVKSEYVIATFF